MSRYAWIGCGILCMLAAAVGCGKGDAVPLSVQGEASAEHTTPVEGTWRGEFVMNPNAQPGDFPETVIEACRSMRIQIDFQPGGKLAMAASMTVPGGEEQTTNMQGRWRIVSREGDTYVVETTEEGREPENGTLEFRGADLFEMSPKNELAELGTMRFTRQK
jgi:hypothetical protein